MSSQVNKGRRAQRVRRVQQGQPVLSAQRDHRAFLAHPVLQGVLDRSGRPAHKAPLDRLV
jgi:hypothetical protein